MKRVTCFLILFLCLIILPVQGKMPTLEDEHYKTACGPIAGLVALHTLGLETSLSEIADRCQWKQDEMLPLESLQKALQSYHGVSCRIVKLTPKQLCDLLKDSQTVVILATRKRSEEIDHAVCAVSVRDNDQIIHLIDYPELHQRKLIGEIADVWDGVALVVRVSTFYRALGDFAVCFAPMVVFITFLLWFLSRRTTKTTVGKPAVNVLLILTCLCVSCNKQETSTMSSPAQEPPKRQTSAVSAKSTLQNSFFLKHHFGEVNAGEVIFSVPYIAFFNTAL